MADNLPARPEDLRFDNLPASLAESFAAGTPMQQFLGTVLDELGGTDAVVDWAEENMGEFIRIVMANNPTPMPVQGAQQANTGVHIHLSEGLGPGPLDITPVSEQ